jgi:HEAT repeats
MTLEKGLAAFLNRAYAREGHVDRHSSKGFEDRKQKDHGMIDAALIEQLSIPHRAPAAYRALLAMGFLAVLLARQGLRHANAAVRYRCCTLLDHYLVPDVLADLVRALDDPHPRVRVAALHALACDRCKESGCRPEENKAGWYAPRGTIYACTSPRPSRAKRS